MQKFAEATSVHCQGIFLTMCSPIAHWSTVLVSSERSCTEATATQMHELSLQWNPLFQDHFKNQSKVIFKMGRGDSPWSMVHLDGDMTGLVFDKVK